MALLEIATFGEALRHLIRASKHTQREFAAAVGVPESEVSRWIHIGGPERKGTFIRICDVLADWHERETAELQGELSDLWLKGR